MIGKRSYPYKSLVGIELEKNKITVAAIGRSGRDCTCKTTRSALLSLDPFAHDPELVGQEIRNHLDAMGVRETQCVVCIPVGWALSHTVDLPDLPPEDERNYVRLQAEREFPFSADDLSLSLSRFTTPDKRGFATIAALPSNHTAILKNIFKAAKLKVVGITIAATALGGAPSPHGRIILNVKESVIEFIVRAGEGIVVLRCFEYDRQDREYDSGAFAAQILREIRISVGQLAGELHETIRDVVVYGSGDAVDPIFALVCDSLVDMGLQVVRGDRQSEFSVRIAPPVEPKYFALAKTVMRFLLSESAVFEFLPPQINRFKQIAERVTSKGNLVLGGTAIAVVFLVFVVFVYQHVRLTRLESEWNAIADKVAEIEILQNNVKQFRPWFDSTVDSLSILQTLTECFPEEGSVWTKTIEIQYPHRVSCSGTARNNSAWRETIDRLRESQQALDIDVQQVLGDAPLQFAFNFRWVEGTNDGR